MSETRIQWRRVATGSSFVGFGVFLFLSAQGLLYNGFWLDALAFWPVLLIALGLRIIFERSKTPWAVLLSPLLIMATLSYVAWRGPATPSTDWRTVRAERDAQTESWRLDASLTLADLDVRSAPVAAGALLEGRVAPSDRGRVRVSDRDAASRVYLRSHDWTTWNDHFMRGPRQRWDVQVADDLPLTLRLSAAFGEGDLDLHDLDVRRVDLDGAFNDLTLRLGVPLEDTRVSLEGAFNQIQLVVPEDTPVHVSTDGFINLVDRRSTARTLSGPAYRLSSEGAFNEVTIRSQ